MGPEKQPADTVTCMAPESQFEAKGPTGVIQHGENTYKVKNGEVSLNGTKIGTMDDEGNYSVRFSRQANDLATGNIKDLIGATYEGSLSSGATVSNRVNGRVQVGADNFAVRNGEVFEGGKRIGTMDGEGRFAVTREGQSSQGSVGSLHGASYHGRVGDGPAVSNQVTGSVEVGGKSYDVLNGKVMLEGKTIGSMNERGEYSIKTASGERVQGRLQDHADARWSGTLSDGKPVQSHASGSVRIGSTNYQVDNGKVSLGGKVIGTVDNDGQFNVKINGTRYRGNVGQLHGAVVQGQTNTGATIDNGPSGSVKVNGREFTVRDGAVFLGNSRTSVGTINSRGEYDVRLNGQQLRGSVQTTPGATWTVTEA